MHDLAKNRGNLGSFIVDARGTILGFDEAMEELTRWPAIDIVGRSKDLSSPGRDVAGSRPLYEGEISMVQQPGILRLALNCRDGRRLDIEAAVAPLTGSGPRAVVTVLRILARSAEEADGLGESRCDPLTRLQNRQGFSERLAQEFRQAEAGARPLALIRLDVDRLRKVNDRLGPSAGDLVIQKIAGILRVAVEDESCIARLGDDDFAILMPGGGRGDARQLAASLRSTVERFRFFEGPGPASKPEVTISLGAASFPADADTEAELFERASEALDEARNMGRNRVWCYLRRPRVPLQVPVFFDAAEPLLVGYSRDLSPSGVFVQTTEPIDIGMRCALAFALPGHGDRVHVVGRVVRAVLPDTSEDSQEVRIPGLGIEFERFGGVTDRRTIDAFLLGRENMTLRPETGILSLS